MKTPPLSPDEARRLEVLRRYVWEGDRREMEGLRELAQLAAQICGTPISVVSLIDDQHQWTLAGVGWEVDQTPREMTICQHVLTQKDLLIVPDVSADERFRDNPWVAGEAGIRFYAGAPLTSPEGAVVGTLCVVDHTARTITPVQERSLGIIARQVMAQLELRRRAGELARTERLLRSIFETEPEAVMVLDGQGVVTMINQAGIAMLEGREATRIVGRRFTDFVTEEFRAPFELLTERVMNGESGRLEFRVAGLKGRICWLETHATAMRSGEGDGIQLLAITRDISERKQAESAASRLAAIVESSNDAIISHDLSDIVTSWNDGAEKIFGYRAAEMIGTSIARIIPESRSQEKEAMLAAIERGETLRHFETERKTRSGDALAVSITVSPIRDPAGQIVGISKIARDITVQKRNEREIIRLSQLYAALSQINQAIVWSGNRDELFAKVCRVLVEFGRFNMAWIGWRNSETHRVMPLAYYGDDNGYLQTIEVHDDNRPSGRGPAGTACREGRSYICNDMMNDPAMLPWRSEGQRRGWRALAAFPIRMGGRVHGALTVYSEEVGFFRQKEVSLLEEAAVDISFALDNFAKDEARRQVEARLQSEQLFSDTMIQSMPGVLYFYDESGKFLRWNRNLETATGYSAEEIADMHPLDFFAAEERGSVQARIAEVMDKGDSFVEAPFLTKSGNKVPYFFTGRRVIFNGQSCLVGVGIDISERKRAEERLGESERRYRDLVEHANSIILRWDADGRVSLLNEFGQRFFGYSQEEILGRNVMGTIVPETESSGRDLKALMEQVRANPRAFEQNVNENMRRNGERVWIAWTNRVERDDRGHVLEILSIGSDITEQRRAEQQIRELNAHLEQRVAERTAELQAALVRAEAADQVKSSFLATMSHELRTPLNSIIGFTTTVLHGMAGPINEEQTKQLGMVQSSGRHLLDLINDVLDLSKIEAGQFSVRAEEFDVRESVERVVGTVQTLADKKGLALASVTAPDVGKMVSDRRRIEQILLNLLNNAIKFTDRGQVTLTTKLLRQPDLEAMVRFEVKDTGMGIRREHLGTLFQPFRQLDAGLARQHEGTGLGLAICQRLAALLGGQITVASEWAKGSDFTVTLPLERTEDP